MADFNGMSITPVKGLSTVANPGNGSYSWIVDSENANAFTLILGGVGSYTTVVISPPGEMIATAVPLGANVNDYAPLNWSLSNRVRLSATLPVNITGFDATAIVGRKDVFNSDTFPITLKHQDAGSIATNRIQVPGGVDLTLYQDDNVSMWYDIVLGAWRLI